MSNGTLIQQVSLDALLKTLNDEQLSAVTVKHNDPVLVLAGAGCGKTAVLTRRIIFLTASGIDPKRIIALTFSRKAAQEMKERIITLLPAFKNSQSPLITTFHSFALRILSTTFDGKSNFERIGFSGTIRLMGQRERLELIGRVVTVSERKFLELSLCELDNQLKKMEVFPDKLKRSFTPSQWLLFTRIEKKVSEYKMKAGLWEFSDLVAGVLSLFKTYPTIAARYSRTYESVLVDEFQDTNPIQIQMLRFMLQSKASLFAVGDDDQAIYGFQGADIRPTREFKQLFAGAQIIKLQTNYRSIPSILNYANRLWVDKPPEYKKLLKSGRTSHPAGCNRPLWRKCKDEKQLALRILKTAKLIHKKHHIRVDSMVALFRVNRTLDTMVKLFSQIEPNGNYIPKAQTVHSSKGLEYPVVFLCDLEEGVFPHYRINKRKEFKSWIDLMRSLLHKNRADVDSETMEEELRLFYVGITRAQRFLFLFTCFAKTGPKNERCRFSPSRFRELV